MDEKKFGGKMKKNKGVLKLLLLALLFFVGNNEKMYSCSYAGNPNDGYSYVYRCATYCSTCDKCSCEGHSSNDENEEVESEKEETSKEENLNVETPKDDTPTVEKTNHCISCGKSISSSSSFCAPCAQLIIYQAELKQTELTYEEKKVLIDSYYEEADFISESMEEFTEKTILAEIQSKYSESKIKELKVEKEYLKEINYYENRKNELESQYQLEGDPVKIVNGEFFQSETDFSTNSFEINRIYQSYNKVVGSFGECFISIFDEGIIRGVDLSFETEILQYESLINDCNSNISYTEKFLSSTYNTKKISEIYALLDKKDASWNEIYTEVLSFLEETEKLMDETADTELYSQALEWKKKADELLTQILSLKEKYAEERKNIKEFSDFIDGQKEIKEATEIKLAEAKSNNSKNLKIKSENTRRNLKNTDESLYENGFNYLTLIEGNSSVKRFQFSESEGVFYKLNQDETLSKTDKIQENSNGYVYFLKNGSQKIYNKNGYLIEIDDVNGNKTVFSRKDNNQIEKITTAENQEFYVYYDKSGFVSRIENPAAKKEYSYQYKNEKLVKVTTPENLVFEYVYDRENGLLEKFVKPDGSYTEFLHEEKDSNQRILTTSTKNEEGFLEKFDFYPEEKKTVYTNQDGEKTIYQYDENGNIIKSIDSAGNSSDFTYDSKGRLISETLNGVKTEYFYNLNDEITKRLTIYLKENGTLVTAVETFSYDDFGNVTNYVDGDGVLYSYIRDEKGNMTEYKIDSTTILALEYNNQGLITKSTDLIDESTGNYLVREYKYDDFQNIIEEKAENYKKTYEYDLENRLTKSFTNGILDAEIIYRDFSTTIREKNGLETVLTYNNRFDLVEKTEKDTLLNITHKTEYLYDLRHLLIQEKIFLDEKDFEIIQYRYSPSGELAGILQMNSISNQGFYQIIHKNGNVETVNDGVFDVKLFSKDFQALMEKQFSKWTEGELQNLVENSESIKSSSVKYSPNQNEILLTDALGRNILYKYNFQNNLEAITKYGENGDFQKVTYDFSKAGKIIGEKNQFGGEVFYVYTSSGLVGEIENQYGTKSISYAKSGLPKKIVDGEGFETEFFYNNQGLLENVKSYNTNVYYFYDSENRLVKEVYGEYPNEKSALSFTKIEYSEDNRKIFVNQGDALFFEIQVDGFGNVLSVKDGENNLKKYEYNGKNQLSKFIDGYGNSAEYFYNPIGNVEKVLYSDGSFEKYTYNEAGFVTKVENPLGVSAYYQYDSGNRLILEKTLAQEEKTYEYDFFDRIVSIKIGNKVLESYEYSDDGKTVVYRNGGATKSDRKIIQKLDDYGKNSVEENSYGERQTIFYDKNGDVSKIIDKNNVSKSIKKIVNSLEYEELIEYSDGTCKKLTYDKKGRLIKEESDNSKNLYTYNQADLLIQQKDLLTGEITTFSYDKAGRKIKTENSNQKVVYEYGKNSEILSVSDLQTNSKIKFGYDSLGREISKEYDNGTRELTKYDENGRIFYRLVEDNRKNILFAEAYYYDKNGYLHGKVNHQGKVTLYEYDDLGQLRIVYAPISSDLENSQKTEIKENGGKIIENQLLKTGVKYLTSEEISIFQNALNSIQVGWGRLVSSLQYFNIEIYEYDFAGNISSKENPFGKIFYQYDFENRLIGSSSQGAFSTDNDFYINYEYDAMGNLLSEKSLQKEVFYTYNNENRLKSVLILDHINKTKTEEAYEYDTFGRRISHQINDEIFLTSYDGLSFNVLYEKEYKNVSQKINIDNSKNSSYRFRYIQESTKEEAISTKSYLYKDSEVLAVSSNSNVAYYSKDIRGSTVYVSDNQGFSGTYDYDSFGKPIFSENYVKYENGYNLDGLFDRENSGTEILSFEESKNLYKNYKTSSVYTESLYDLEKSSYFEYLSKSGYSGKNYNLNTGLNDYGLRDYSSKIGRFITEDPIRDGSNWYSFSRNNPINFVDLYGLYILDQDDTLQNSDQYYTTVKLGTGNDSIYDSGCVLTTYTRIANTLGAVTWPLDVVNQIAIDNNLFTENDLLEVAAGVKLINILLNGTGLSVEYVESLDGSTTEIAEELFDYMNSDSGFLLTARIKTSNKDNTKRYEHSLTINSDCVEEYAFSDTETGYNIKISDTSNVGRKQIYDDVRENELLRVDTFKVNSKFCNLD